MLRQFLPDSCRDTVVHIAAELGVRMADNHDRKRAITIGDKPFSFKGKVAAGETDRIRFQFSSFDDGGKSLSYLPLKREMPFIRPCDKLTMGGNVNQLYFSSPLCLFLAGNHFFSRARTSFS